MRYKRILYVLMLLCFLTGCGTGSEPAPDPSRNESSKTQSSESETSQPSQNAGDFHPYQTPAFADAVFHDTQEVDGVKLDLSSTANGYVAVSATSSARLKFQVIKGEETYTYNIASDGTPSIFPLQCGNGTYTFKVMENVVDTKYAEKYTAEAEVQLTDEFQPYLRPSDYVDYTQTSACVKKAQELAADCETELDVVQAVFDYICNEVTYDKVKASNVEKGYLPDPDETLSTKKGICFDYASLAAAMLRSQGIPTRVIFGYVSPNDLYHAWNMFYTDETGWVTVDYQVSANSWNRLDLTFSANGADTDFIGDGTNYADVYVY